MSLPINTKLSPTVNPGHSDQMSLNSWQVRAGKFGAQRKATDVKRNQTSVISVLSQQTWRHKDCFHSNVTHKDIQQYHFKWIWRCLKSLYRQLYRIRIAPYQLPCAHSAPSAHRRWQRSRFFHAGCSSCFWQSIRCGVSSFTPYCHGLQVFRAGCLHWGWSKHEVSI